MIRARIKFPDGTLKTLTFDNKEALVIFVTAENAELIKAIEK